MIHLSHVYKTYLGPTHALRDICFQIEKGEFVFLTGPSGSGKTTLFKLIAGFDKPTSGQIKAGDYNLHSLSKDELPYYRRKIGVVFQDFKLLKNKTLFENVSLPLEINGENPQTSYNKVFDILDTLGLSDKAHQYPDFVSGGEQQRTAIARAVVHQPSILIADEPTGNLDQRLSEEIMDVFEKICAKGTTIFLATHDQFLIEKYPKRRIELFKGALTSSHLKQGLSL